MLNDGILALRRRTVWEAADTGLLLWRRNLGYLILFFAIPFWISAFALLLAGNVVSAELLSGRLAAIPAFRAWCILWWLNPLFDRCVLHVAAARYFEPGLPFRALLRGLGGSLGRGLAGDLLWRRLSPWRASVMPLRVLERGGPAAARKIGDRKRTLARGGLNFCVFLSAWCFLLQWILVLGETIFIFIVSRLFFNSALSFDAFWANGGLYVYTLWCVNYLVVESLYVCMGFGLYLNSRVEAEGWDIELLFRKFAARRRGPVLLVSLFLGLGLPRLAGVFGQSPGSLPPDVGAAIPEGTLEKILERDMGGERKTWGIRFKEGEEKPVKTIPQDSDFSSWLVFFRRAAALALRAGLILAFAALALACGIFAYRRRNRPRLSRPGASPEAPVPRTAAAPSPETLLAEAGRLYNEGSSLKAWGLCYTGSLDALARYRLIRFPPGATEYRCLALVRRHQSGLERSFADLIRHWTGLAYGGIQPPQGAFDEALAWALSLRGTPRENPPAARGSAVHG